MLPTATQKVAEKVAEKVAFKYICHLCDYYGNNLTDYKKHLKTEKHKKRQIVEKSSQNNYDYKCSCGKVYKHKSSYYRHIHKCNSDNVVLSVKSCPEEQKISVDIVMKILEENKSLQNLLIKQQEEFMNQQQKFFIKQQEENDKKYENIILNLQPKNCNKK